MIRNMMSILIAGMCSVAWSASSSPMGESTVSPVPHDELLAVLTEGSDLGITDSNSLRTAVAESVGDFQRIRQQLMSQQIEPLKEPDLQEQSEGLRQLVDRLRSLDISPAMMKPQADTTTADSNDISMAVETSKDTNDMTSTVASSTTEESELKPEARLLELLQGPDGAIHPLPLADVLYRQGYYAEALTYYEMVQQSLKENDVVNHQWILFQIANCTREIDPAGALELYEKFIQHYPNAKWTPVASSRKTLLEWNQMSQIKEFVNKDVAVVKP